MEGTSHTVADVARSFYDLAGAMLAKGRCARGHSFNSLDLRVMPGERAGVIRAGCPCGWDSGYRLSGPGTLPDRACPRCRATGRQAARFLARADGVLVLRWCVDCHEFSVDRVQW